MRTGLTAAVAMALVGAAQAQPSAAPQFAPGPGYAGVAGTAAETARITALCGANRNARDGYAPSPAFPGQTKAPLVRSKQGFAVEEVARIDRPWGAAFLPDGKMLVSFRAGGMRIVGRDGTVSEPLAGVPQIYQQRIGTGMYDLVLDRDFRKNRTIYFTYHTKAPTDPVALGRIASAQLSADETSLTGVKVLREGPDIQARRLVQARDGTLIAFSAGDLADVGPDPQTLSTQLGKALRINTDGSIPKDNPFLGARDANPAIWAMGFRDIHSAAVNPRTGEVWAAENVPMGGDEVNIFKAGKNYGFPVISYGRQNSGALINGGKTAQQGLEQPRYYWNPSIAPSGMLFYTGAALPGWKDSLFIGAMSGMQLVRLEVKGDRIVGEEKLLLDSCRRFKTVLQGPDGDIYLLTDESPPKQNAVLRLVPAKAAPAPKAAPAKP
jgi:glucose/arabinose dehydrogenase